MSRTTRIYLAALTVGSLALLHVGPGPGEEPSLVELVAAGALFVAWLALIVFCLRASAASADTAGKGTRIALRVVLLAIVLGSTMPSAWSSGLSNLLRDRAVEFFGTSEVFVAPPLRPGSYELSLPWLLRKAGHIGFYAALALVVFVTAGRRSVPLTLACCLVVGLATELLQFFRPGRVPTLHDVAFDLAGAGLAMAGALVARRMRPPTDRGRTTRRAAPEADSGKTAA